MAADPLRFGILGAARIAPMALVRPARRVTEATVLAVAARDPERARQFAARHGIPRVHPSYDALLADPEVDAIYNPLPNSLHAPWTTRALAAGKHVLCEKPFAANAAEAEEMARAADRAAHLLALLRLAPAHARHGRGQRRARERLQPDGAPHLPPAARADAGGDAQRAHRRPLDLRVSAARVRRCRARRGAGADRAGGRDREHARHRRDLRRGRAAGVATASAAGTLRSARRPPPPPPPRSPSPAARHTRRAAGGSPRRES